MRIYLITPAWTIENKRDFYKSIKKLKNVGFKIKNRIFFKNVRPIEKRVEEIHNAFKDKTTDIILAVRGGFGCMKLLPYLNFSMIKNNPKIFAGFSDLSILLNTLYEKTGIITLHSPMLLNFSNVDKLTMDSFLNAIDGFKNRNLFHNAPVEVFASGISEGILKGGNLISLTALIGTEWEITTDDSILLFEEVNERLHTVDRCITQWYLAKKFKNIKGLILGDFKGLKIKDVFKIFKEYIPKIPTVYCPYIGHTKTKITLPIGRKLRLNTYKKELTILQNSKNEPL